MKKAIPVILILFSILMVSVMPTEKDAAIYEDTVRLHILANSDSEEDQGLKLEIRDEILERYGSELKNAGSCDEAKAKIATLLTEIEQFAEVELTERGYSYSVCAELSEEWYDTREYDGFTLPKGYYSSLIIRIGRAEGKNWWCVMFPPLCLDIATEDAPSDDAIIDYTKEEISLITGGEYKIKFKILELLSDAFE